MKLTLSVASFYQLFKERRLDIHGLVSCPLLDTEPLRVESGDCWVRPHDGVPEQHGLAHALLRYRLTLTASTGQRFWLSGTKTARPARDVWRQCRALTVQIGRPGEPAAWSGELVVPADSFVREQIDGVRVSPTLPPNEQRTAKLLWLAWFGAQFGAAFLDPMLRAFGGLLDGRR
jgi:hypothetical protein